MDVGESMSLGQEKIWCVPASILCAWIWHVKRGWEVRIAVSKIDANTDHAQAEALNPDNDEWTPLTEIWDGESMAVIPYRRHFPEIEPYRYLSMREWIEEQL
jgi:hypothetical protein